MATAYRTLPDKAVLMSFFLDTATAVAQGASDTDLGIQIVVPFDCYLIGGSYIADLDNTGGTAGNFTVVDDGDDLTDGDDLGKNTTTSGLLTVSDTTTKIAAGSVITVEADETNGASGNVEVSNIGVVLALLPEDDTF